MGLELRMRILFTCLYQHTLGKNLFIPAGRKTRRARYNPSVADQSSRTMLVASFNEDDVVETLLGLAWDALDYTQRGGYL